MGDTDRTAGVVIQVDDIDLVPFSSVTDDELIATGEADREALRHRTAHAGLVTGDALVHRVEFRVAADR